MIYFARAGSDGLVKIGWTKFTDPTERIDSFRPIVPEKITVIRSLEGDRWVETWLHKQFAEHRVRGEWFTFHPDMLTIMPPPERLRSEPQVRKNVALMVWFPDDLLADIDAYRGAQPRPEPRLEAIRRLIAKGLEVRRPVGET